MVQVKHVKWLGTGNDLFLTISFFVQKMQVVLKSGKLYMIGKMKEFNSRNK